MEILKQLQVERVLITNYYASNYAGSELITLDLAQTFKRWGKDVTVASICTGSPLIDHFHSSEIQIINLIESPQSLLGQKFDLIWSHHWPVLGFCLHELEISTRYLILASLSPFEPLESLSIAANQAHGILFNSEENLNYQKSELKYDLESFVQVFPNSLPPNWLEQSPDISPKDHLQILGIVSNHIPAEISAMKSALEATGVEVKTIGIEVGQTYVTPEWIDQLDAVITIGHTVQKAMSRGIPVYCYDRFGGPGWLTTANLERAAAFNYSGRCCNRQLSPTDLLNDIVQGYSSVQQDLESLRQFALQHYNLDENTVNVLNSLSQINREFDPKKLTKTERKLCQLALRHDFVISPVVNIEHSDMGFVAIQLHTMPADQLKDRLAVFSVDGLPDKGYLFDSKQPFKFGGVALSQNSGQRIISVFATDHQAFEAQAEIGLYSPDIGQSYPSLPFSYSSRYLFQLSTLPKEQEISIYVGFLGGENLMIAKLSFLRAESGKKYMSSL